VTTTVERPGAAVPEPASVPTGLLGWLTTTDHKRIGLSYIFTAIAFFGAGGVLALLIRTQLAQPNLSLVDADTYNEFFTMHGSIMIYLFAVPFAFGLANYIVPLQVGAPDVAFPRLNALGYWLYLFGGLTMISGFLTAGGAAKFGWFAYAPLSGAVYSPGVGADLWIVGVVVTSTAGVLTAVNLVTTIFMLRAPGMTMFRMPIYTWNMLITSMLVLLTFPVLTAALVMLFFDRHLDTHIFEATKQGTPILWQHMFWFFGHPEVYIIALPFFGVVTEVIAVFARRPVFGYRTLVFATLAIGGLSVGVWAHHMYATGAVLLPFFTIMSMAIAVPTGIKFFNWIGTMWGGRISFQTPMLFAIGMLAVFLLGGLTGVLQAMAPVDFSLTDTYFIVAHMHYVIMGLVLGAFAGVYYWFPKMTGRMLNDRLGKIHFWAFFVGSNVTFFVQHQLGLDGMPRRVATYRESDGWGTLNLISTIGAYILAIGVLAFLWNLVVSLRRGAPAGPDPWGGHTLEWATASPPPEHNFDSLPPIRSERPVWDLHHPDLARDREPTHGGTRA
jgi:cytochrome c oxidase subunit 1